MIDFWSSATLQSQENLRSYWCEMMAGLHAVSFDRPWHADDFFALAQRPTALWGLLPAVDATDILDAMIVVDDMIEEAEILTLAVRPCCRNRGLGKKIMNHLVKYYPRPRYFLDVATDNIAAIKLYSALGFKGLSVRKGYYQHGGEHKDALVMVLQDRIE